MNTSEKHSHRDDRVERFAWINFMVEKIASLYHSVYVYITFFSASNSTVHTKFDLRNTADG